MKDKTETMMMGEGWLFYCKKCGKYIGRINGWEFHGFSEKATLNISGMDLCQKCGDDR